MSSRMDVELTSTRPDGSWTWRKAGARQPKGEATGVALPDGSAVGAVFTVDYENTMDGIDVVAVLPPKGARKDRHERIEIKTTAPEQLVTSTLVPKGKGRRDGDSRGPRRDGDSRGPRRDGDGRPGRDGGPGGRDRDRGPRSGGDRPSRPPRPVEPERPKAKRLRPGRAHRTAVLETLAPEQRALAEQVLRGGVPAVRQAVEQQNAENREKGLPEIQGDELVALAESMLPKLRTAEWQDKADAALAVIDELDLKDLRSVVVAADGAAKDDETRAQTQQLREALTRRVELEHSNWLTELGQTLSDGRLVRALRLSSRPPKAGEPLPKELAEKLATATSENLSAETSHERWATVLDALSFSPVRTSVKPVSVPAEIHADLKAVMAKLASKLPHIAELFGIDPSSVPRQARRRTGGGAKGATPSTTPSAPKVPPPPARDDAAAPEAAAVDDAPVVEAATEAAPAVEAAPVVEAATETAPAVEAAPVVEAAPEAVTEVDVEASSEAPAAEPPEAESPAGDGESSAAD